MNFIPTPRTDAIIQTSLKYKDILKLREYYRDHLAGLETELIATKSNLQFARNLLKLQNETFDQLRESLDEVRKQRDEAIELANKAINIVKNK